MRRRRQFFLDDRVHRSINPEAGFSMVTVVFVILALSVVALGLTSQLSTQAFGSVLEFQGKQALYLADGVLQYILADKFRNDTDYSNNLSPTGDPYGADAISFGGGQAWVQYSNLSSDEATITVTSQVGESVRKIKQSISKELGEVFQNSLTSVGNSNLGGATNVNFGSGATAVENYTGPLPTINMNDYINLTAATHTGTLNIESNYATSIYVTGNIDIGSTNPSTPFTVGTSVNPVVIVASGNITVRKNMTAFYGVLAASGSVDFLNVKDMNLYDMQTAGGKTLPVVVADGSSGVSFQVSAGTPANPNDLVVNGYVLSGSHISFNPLANATIAMNGPVIAYGNVTVGSTGNLSFNYDPALSSALSNDFLVLQDWEELT